jgi:hypothetical protein
MKTLRAHAFNKHADRDNRGLKEMQPKLVYLFADATTVERLGRFLCGCAKEMRGRLPFHRHFRDYLRNWDTDMLDIVIERPTKPKPKSSRKR